jgi:antirestriction protein ArdC
MEKQKSAPKNGTAQKDVYQLINDKLITQLQQGIIPWRIPWADRGLPTNLRTRNPYRGINVILLAMLGYEHNFFLTEKQVGELGGTIKDGELPNAVAFWRFSEGSAVHTKPKLESYGVYNPKQCDWQTEQVLTIRERETTPIAACEAILATMPERPEIRHKEQKAYYEPVKDFINMPKRKGIGTEEKYFALLFHQLAHATGNASRLGRKDLIQMAEIGSDAFTHEELVAEIATYYLLSFVGISYESENGIGAALGWMQKLQHDKNFVISAATHAQKAVDYILKLERKKGGEE